MRQARVNAEIVRNAPIPGLAARRLNALAVEVVGAAVIVVVVNAELLLGVIIVWLGGVNTDVVVVLVDVDVAADVVLVPVVVVVDAATPDVTTVIA